MQKKVIALAVAGLLSGAAYAQSNVTIYGAADVSIENVKASGARVGSQADVGSTMRVQSNSSILGFRGNEDLGGGLKLLFQAEAEFLTDSANAGGTANYPNFKRDTFVGVEGGFGQVKAGIITGPARDLGAKTDMVVGATGVGSMIGMLGKIAGGTSMATTPAGQICATTGEAGPVLCPTAGAASNWDTRRNNAIQYTSPKFSGFEVRGLYAPGENRVAGPNGKAGQTYELGGFYNNGGWYAGLTYGQLKYEGQDANKLQNVRLAGSYTFQPGHKVAALWEQNQYKVHGGGSVKQMTYGVGGKFKVSQPGAVIAQVYATSKVKDNGNDFDQTQARFIAVGYEHSLSKRTTLKAYYSKITNKERAVNNYTVGNINVANNGAAISAGADPQAFSVGVRHTF